VEEDLELGYTKNTMVQGIPPIHHLSDPKISPHKEEEGKKMVFSFRPPALLIHQCPLQNLPFPKAMKSFKQPSSILPL
jgi:hypothetical protein